MKNLSLYNLNDYLPVEKIKLTNEDFFLLKEIITSERSLQILYQINNYEGICTDEQVFKDHIDELLKTLTSNCYLLI